MNYEVIHRVIALHLDPDLENRGRARKLVMNATLCVSVKDAGPQNTQQIEARGNLFRRYNPSCSPSFGTFSHFFKTHFTKDFCFFSTE